VAEYAGSNVNKGGVMWNIKILVLLCVSGKTSPPNI
jgi:hypothetical protein